MRSLMKLTEKSKHVIVMYKKIKILISCLAMMPLASMAQQGLKDAIGKYCLIGAAVNQWQSDGQVPQADAVLAKHFNCVVAENCMKPEVLAPAEGIFDFRVADKFVNYAQQLGLKGKRSLSGMALAGSRLVVY